MSIINAAITAVGGYLPEDKITNADLEKMVDTNNEWIMTRVGIRERRILKDPTKGASFLGIEAVKDLFSRNNIDPATIDGIIVATNTADYHFPTTASIVAFETGCINAFTFDMQAACPSFIYALEAGANYIRSGRYKRIIVLAAEKMTAITDYTDRATCPLFGDGAACVLLEPTEENEGVLDSYFRTDGTGRTNLIMKSGGSANPPSHETVDRREHYVYQEGAAVFKQAVKGMSSSCRTIMERNGLSYDDIAWVVPHQANLRIIDAVAREMQVPLDRVMVNIEYRGNTSSATIPLCIWEFEKQHPHVLRRRLHLGCSLRQVGLRSQELISPYDRPCLPLFPSLGEDGQGLSFLPLHTPDDGRQARSHAPLRLRQYRGQPQRGEVHPDEPLGRRARIDHHLQGPDDASPHYGHRQYPRAANRL